MTKKAASKSKEPRAASAARTTARPAKNFRPPRTEGQQKPHPVHLGDCEGLFQIAEGKLVGFHLGPTQYSFRRPFAGVVSKVGGGGCTFELAGFDPAVVGRGEDPRKASYSWACQTHSLFQRLRRQSASPLEGPEKKEFVSLASCIDVDAMEAIAIRTVRQNGRVLESSTTDRVVAWLGYEDPERIPLELGPGEFAALKAGERFEAVVERQLPDFDLVAVLCVDAIPASDAVEWAEVQKKLEEAVGSTARIDVSERWRTKEPAPADVPLVFATPEPRPAPEPVGARAR